jgi:biopolymer transport protein ExbD
MNFRRLLELEMESFQMAPLIDIVFNCLVFYIITTALAQIEQQMDINVPTAQNAAVPQQRTPFFVNITKEGGVFISNRAFTNEELRAWLKDLHDAYAAAPPAIVIRADRDTAFQHFVKVLDACAGANIRNVAFANVEERRGPGR